MESPKAYSYIRFSTPGQITSDSLRRQLEASRTWASEHGLTLDESLQDLGLSAFKGIHRIKGALGTFLDMVKSHKIESGSFLIVENLDRLSRQEVLEALSQFTSIIQAGITIVTLQDGMIYSKESITDNWSQLIISITYMARAYDESLRKSQRISEAWKQKRGNINNHILTGKVPAWIKVSEDRKKFILIPEVCKAIETIYRMKLTGKGANRIERELNEDKKIWSPPKSKRNKSGGWRKSYINKLLLNNRQLIGEFQPYILKTGKRVPEGVLIPEYFPEAIPKDLFLAVQEQIERNAIIKGHAGGRTGKASNLFTHRLFCGECGGAMHYIDKGNNSKGGQYLHCDQSRRKTGDCKAKPVKYDEFEKLFFEDFPEVDLSEFISGQDELKSEIQTLQRTIDSAQYNLKELDRQMNNLINDIANEDNTRLRDALKSKYKALDEERNSLAGTLESHEKKLKELHSSGKTMQENFDATQKIYDLLRKATDEKQKTEIRLKLRGQVQQIVDSIKVYPLYGTFPEVEETEPGIVRWTNSKYIRKAVIRYKGGKKLRIIQCQGYSDITE